jgi:hypothetical protein
MATQKQIDADRRNALKSTGPRSEEGKAKIRRNALREGLTGQVITLLGRRNPHLRKARSRPYHGLRAPQRRGKEAHHRYRMGHMAAESPPRH